MFELRLMNNQMEFVQVDEERDLLSSIRLAGLDPVCDCSGDGNCGRCRARVVAGSISNVTDLEMKYLTPNELSCGWFLMCQRKPLGDLIIDMPQRNPLEMDLTKEPVMENISPRVKKRAVDFKQLAEQDFTDYQTLLLEHFAKFGVKSVNAKALEQIVPALQAGNGLVTVVYSDKILGVEVGDTTALHYGVAVDLGTAALGLKLIDIANKEVVGKIYSGSCLRSFGYNMEQRVKYLQKHNEDCREMHRVLLDTVNKLILRLCDRVGVAVESIYDLLLGGNPQLTHLLFDIAPRSVSEPPVFLSLTEKSAGEMGIAANEVADVAAIPCMNNEFGGDVAAVCDICHEEDTLIVDLGVDTKLIFNHDGTQRFKQVSTPVFEGMCLEQGMIAGEGAIIGYYWDEQAQNAFARSQGYMSPCGVSGVGLWSLALDLKNLGYVNADNQFVPENMPENVAKKIETTATGRQMTLAGGGFMKTLLAESDLQLLADTTAKLSLEIADFIAEQAVKKIIITGAADMDIDLQTAERIGLLPPQIDWQIVEFVPQLALTGITEKLLHR